MTHRLAAVRAVLAGSAIVAISLFNESALGQGKLEAKYVATLAGIPIGRGSWVIEVSEGGYTAVANGQVVGLLKMLSNGDGSVTVHGGLEGGRLFPARYSARTSVDGSLDEVRMGLNSGAVTDLVVEPSYPPTPDRVAVLDAHRRGVLDPMSASLVPIPGNGDVLTPEVCHRTLAIFDGRQRFDLALSFKRTDSVKAEKGYQGPAVVCMVRYQPVSGHRPGRFAIQYLMATREMEMWLAPIAGTRILVPFRISVPTLIGPALLQATQFVTSTPASRDSAAAQKIQ